MNIPRRRTPLACALLLALALAGPVLAAGDAPSPGGDGFGLGEKDVRVVTLKNGMTFLLLERHLSPTFSAVIMFNVGGVDETPGITGTSHLLEHMMFKGTKLFGTTDYEAEKPYLDRIDAVHEKIRAEEDRRRRYGIAPFVLDENPDPPANETLEALRRELRDLQKEQADRFLIKNELWSTYLQNGGTGLNASTGSDSTQYYVSFPKNRLEMWALMEADRMRNPVLREFYSERDVVHEERRMRTDNQPFGRMREELSAVAFKAHPYGLPVIGWASDLLSLTKEETEAYFRTYYAPNNAVCALVGDFRTDEVIPVLEKHFGAIPSQAPPHGVHTREPEQRGRRTVEVEFDAKPSIMVGYPVPQDNHPDAPALEVLGRVLSSGRTSRLYQELVLQRRLALNVRAGGGGGKFPDLFVFSGSPRAPHTTEELVAAWEEQVQRLVADGVTDWEIGKIRNQIEVQYVRSLDSNMGLAFRLASAQNRYGDWTELLRYREKIRAVTAEDVVRVAKKYLRRSSSNVVVLVPTAGAPAGGGTPAPATASLCPEDPASGDPFLAGGDFAPAPEGALP